MNNKKLAFASALLGLTASAAFAAPVTYQFDTLTSINLHHAAPTIAGVLRNSPSITTIGFADATNVDYRYVVSRCVPVFLTMMEKPGRYWLNVTIDPANSSLGLVSCELTLRS